MNIVRQDGGLAQGRSCKTSCGGQIEIVGPVRNQFVAKAFQKVIATNQKCAGHLLHIAGGQSNEVAVEPGKQHGSQMHEGQPGAFGFQFRAEFGELGDRLATKGSAKVAEEHQEQGAVGRNEGNRFAGLRLVRLQ